MRVGRLSGGPRATLIVRLVEASAIAMALTFGCSGDEKGDGDGEEMPSSGAAGMNVSGGAGDGAGGSPLSGGANAGGAAGEAGDGASGAAGETSDAGNGGASGTGSEPPVARPASIRPRGAELSGYVDHSGVIGGVAHWDVCPEDEFVVGFRYKNASDLLGGLVVECGKVEPAAEPEELVRIAEGATLLERGGAASIEEGEVHCPEHQVVVGFEGAHNDWLRKLTFSCAPLRLVNRGGIYEVAVGDRVPLRPFGRDSDPRPANFPYTACPAGQVARGTKMHVSSWVEGLGLLCATPTPAYPRGSACLDAVDCEGSTDCVGNVCVPRACDAPSGCSCRQLDGRTYVFCEPTADSTHANAWSRCVDQGRRLVWIQSELVQGWMRYAANDAGFTGPVWIGADDLANEGEWVWASGGGGVEFAAWGIGEPNALPGEDCAELLVTGVWNDADCERTYAYVCE